MVKQNYFGATEYLDTDNSMDIDQVEGQNISSQSDSKLYESNSNKNSETKHSISETVTNRESRTTRQNKYKENDSEEDASNKKCIEKSSGDTQIDKESCPVRAESMIRQTITKMEKHRTVIPGMASARSLTNLISADYGWTPTAVYSKVEKALKSAADHGIIKEMINKQNGQKSYTVPDSRVKKYAKSFYKQSGNSKTYFYKHFSDLMNDE